MVASKSRPQTIQALFVETPLLLMFCPVVGDIFGLIYHEMILIGHLNILISHKVGFSLKNWVLGQLTLINGSGKIIFTTFL
jgi:hypothetical protein